MQPSVLVGFSLVRISTIDIFNLYGHSFPEIFRVSIRVYGSHLQVYRVQVSDKDGQDIFNGLADNVKLTSGNMAFNLPLIHSRAGAIIIKEIYCGGCTKLPLEGNYVLVADLHAIYTFSQRELRHSVLVGFSLVRISTILSTYYY